MGTFGRSWALTKLSFEAIGKDKEMLLFPVLAGIFSLLFSGALLFPTVLIDFVRGAHAHPHVRLDPIAYALLFVSYLGLACISTFFNVCVVYTTKTRFEGGDATFFQSIGFALSRLHLILAWSLVSATVGLVLHALDRASQRAGVAGRIIIGILRAALGAMWSIVTLFVVPVMVYENVGPFTAIKRSAETLRSTWGESLVRHYGLGLIQFLFLLLGVIGAFGLVYVSATMHLALAVVLASAGALVVYFLGVILVFAVANSVYNTALYAYASGHRVEAFSRDALDKAFRATAA